MRVGRLLAEGLVAAFLTAGIGAGSDKGHRQGSSQQAAYPHAGHLSACCADAGDQSSHAGGPTSAAPKA